MDFNTISFYCKCVVINKAYYIKYYVKYYINTAQYKAKLTSILPPLTQWSTLSKSALILWFLVCSFLICQMFFCMLYLYASFSGVAVFYGVLQGYNLGYRLFAIYPKQSSSWKHGKLSGIFLWCYPKCFALHPIPCSLQVQSSVEHLNTSGGAATQLVWSTRGTSGIRSLTLTSP